MTDLLEEIKQETDQKLSRSSFIWEVIKYLYRRIRGK
jgi:hypothetical protein